MELVKKNSAELAALSKPHLLCPLTKAASWSHFEFRARSAFRSRCLDCDTAARQNVSERLNIVNSSLSFQWEFGLFKTVFRKIIFLISCGDCDKVKTLAMWNVSSVNSQYVWAWNILRRPSLSLAHLSSTLIEVRTQRIGEE